ncbi:MAG: ABC transporter substrate-binding protein [Gemmatimonadota bacterium]
MAEGPRGAYVMVVNYRLTCLVVLLAGAGCGETPRRGDTVLFASGADLQSINPLLTVHPLARQVQRYVLLTTLVRYDSTLAPVPYLARSWAFSVDGRALTFTLQPGVRWHDGAPTTAADVVWTLDAARDPATGYPRLNDLSSVDSIMAIGDSLIWIHFRERVTQVPDVFTDLAILPSHLLGTTPHDQLRTAAWNEHPVGNGPFRFVAHEPNRRWVFVANGAFPQALGGPPRLQRLVVAVVDEPVTKLAALASGELDFAGIQPAHATFVERDPRLRVLSYPLLFTYGIVFNCRRAPFNDMTVRRALSLALDRREIVDGYSYGFATPATGPRPPEVGGTPPAAVSPANADSARALLHGRRISFELLTVGSGEAALEQMIQAQLARAGFDVHIRQLELSAYLGRVRGPRPEFDAAVMGIQGDIGLGYIVPLAALTGLGPAANASEAERQLADSASVAFLYHARGLQGANRRVQDVRMDLRGELATVARWWVRP